MTGSYRPGHGFDGDPRLGLARALMGQGASTAPVQSPLEGLARALQGPLGGYMGNRVKQGGQEGMAAALAALGDQSMDPQARLAAADAAYGKADPGGDNPISGVRLSTLVQSLMPKKAESPLGKLYDDMKNLPAEHPVRKMFETAMAKDAGDPTYLAGVEGTKKKAERDAINATPLTTETPAAKAAVAGAEAEARAPYQAMPVVPGGNVVAPFAKGAGGAPAVAGAAGAPDAPPDPRIIYKDPRLPADVQAKLDTALANSGAISNALTDFAEAFKGAGAGERAKSVAGIQTPLNTSYNKAALLAKGQELFDLGVLNGPDLDIIRRTLPDPSTIAGQASGAESAKAATESVRMLLQDRINGFMKQKGLPPVDLVAYGKSLRPAKTEEPPAGDVSRETPGGAPKPDGVVPKMVRGDQASRDAYAKLPSGGAYYDDQGTMRFKP